MKLKNAAKVNLALDITGRLPNGYHLIESVFQTVGIYDEITVEPDDRITVSCSVPDILSQSDDIPCDERNIAYKAAKLFFEESGVRGGCSVHIKKEIPSQAGMGGGSSDAAAVLYMLNKLTGAGLSVKKLSEIGQKLGADVPFFLIGGTAYVSGIGEKIIPISDYSGKILVIGKGKEGVSTAAAYQNADAIEDPVRLQIKNLVDCINSGGASAHLYFGNIFESAVRLDEVETIKERMFRCGALNAVMTGSGSAVFGLFDSRESAESCENILAEQGFFAQTCETVRESFLL